MYMLDTNTCIYVLKRHSKRVRHRFKATKNLCISAISYAELCYGIEHGPAERRRERWEQLQLFTQLLLIDPLGEEAGRRYGQLRAWLRGQGQPIGNNDLLIAAHALSLGAVLVTNNERGFGHIPDLTVENWL